MNERIRELAEQAGADFMRRINYNNLEGKEYEEDAGVIFESNESFEKFAESIVRECARVARATPAPNFHEHLKQQLGHTWDMASSEAGREIVKHFGVEE
jgi:hypothetical protein